MVSGTVLKLTVTQWTIWSITLAEYSSRARSILHVIAVSATSYDASSSARPAGLDQDTAAVSNCETPQ
jgi:hypothetical protein